MVFKNKNQILAILPGENENLNEKCSSIAFQEILFKVWLMMISGGMFISYSLVNIFLGYQLWSSNSAFPELFIISASFHFAAALGAILCGLLLYKLESNYLHVDIHNKFIEYYCQWLIQKYYFRLSIQ
jgi:hypothetical protein